MPAAELPGGLAPPLHFPSPPGWGLKIMLALLALTLLWRLWRLLRDRRARAPARRRRRRSPTRPPAAGGIGSLIDAIRARHLDGRSYRLGCHELSSTLRDHWEQRGLAGASRSPLTRLTAREIARQVGDRPATRLLEMLSELQFGRRPPSRADFVGACDLARETVAAGKRR